MKSALKFLLPAVLTVVSCVCAASAEEVFAIARRGAVADCVIRLPENPSPSQSYAAEELNRFVFRMTGVRLPMEGGHKREIRIETLEREDLSTDGFEIVCDGKSLVLRGSAVRGCLYAVYELLERFGGVRWYTSWCEKIPSLDVFAVPAALHVVSRPAFEMRQPLWYDFSSDPEFAARLRVNAYNYAPVTGVSLAHLGGNSYRFGGDLPSCHTFARLCDPRKYFASHPEYFSLVNGKRLAKRTQLCLTNPDVLDIVTSNVLERIRRDPGAKFYGVSQNDWLNFCECEKCAAVDREEGSNAGTMIRFVNAVAERVEKEFPGVFIETLAYQYTRKPPLKTKPRKNVVICLCTIELDFASAIDESAFPENRAFMQDISGWGKITDRLYVWDYVTQFPHYPHAFANVYTLQGNLRFFRDNKVSMIFEQGQREGHHAGFAELKGYLLAKLMWDPDLDLKTLLDDFFEGYYAEAAGAVREYFELLHKLQREYSKDGKHPLTIFLGVAHPPYSDETFMAEADRLWAKALASVSEYDRRYYNVKMGAFSHYYTKLELMRAAKKDSELKNDPRAVELARWLLKAKALARGPMLVREWGDKSRIDGWKTIASGAGKRE